MGYNSGITTMGGRAGGGGRASGGGGGRVSAAQLKDMTAKAVGTFRGGTKDSYKYLVSQGFDKATAAAITAQSIPLFGPWTPKSSMPSKSLMKVSNTKKYNAMKSLFEYRK